MKLKNITLLCPIHKACGTDEQPLYRYDCVRVLPVPGAEDERAVACAVDGRVVAVGLARSNVIALLPSHVPPKSLSEPWIMSTAGEVGGLVAGRHSGKQNNGLLVYEATDDAKLAIGVDQIAEAEQRIALGEGWTVTLDAAELLKVASAISATSPGSKPGTVTLYVEKDRPVCVLGSMGIGIVQQDKDVAARTVFADVFNRIAGDVRRAFNVGDAKARAAKGGRIAAALVKNLKTMVESDDKVESVTFNSGGKSVTLKGRRKAGAK